MTTWAGDGFLHLIDSRLIEAPDGVYATELTPAGLRSYTTGKIIARVDDFAAGLAARGIVKGARVACMMDTHTDYLCMVLAIARLGAVWVPIGTRLTPANLAYMFAEADVDLVIAESAKADVVAAARHPSIPVILRDGPLVLPSEAPAPRVEVQPSDLLMISFTSGTTGKPKSVPVTHAMMRFAAEAAARASHAEKGAVLYVWEPFNHIGGAQLIILPLIRDATLALAQRFTASGFWDQVRLCGATRIHHLGGILQLLLKQPPTPRDRDHGVTLAWGGGCTADVWTAFSDRFGVEMVECYGMTEASSLTTINAEGLPGYIGRALPWFDVRILASDGTECPRGTKGEIVVTPIGQGVAALFTGYMNSATATAEALRDGRLFTGDLGEMDDEGRVKFLGRLKDTIRVRGENVSAWEVEHVVEQHEAVAGCAVIPVRAEIGEADVKLFIQLAPDRRADGQQIFDWLRARLAPHQLPRHISFVQGFERTPSQRIMKHTLDTTPSGDWIRP